MAKCDFSGTSKSRADGRDDCRQHWTDSEVDETAFKDARLGRRFGEVIRQIGDGMGESIPYACQDWASTKAAYRFFANDRVEEGEILNGHFSATRDRFAASSGPVLLIQDTTEFTYQREATDRIGMTKSVNSGNSACLSEANVVPVRDGPKAAEVNAKRQMIIRSGS